MVIGTLYVFCMAIGTLAEFKSFVMNNKAFGNLFCNSQKSFHTSPGSSDSNNRGYRSFFKLNNGSTMAFAFTKNPRIFCKCKCHCWVWRMIDSLYYSSRKVPERCENLLQNKLPNALWFNEANYERNELTQCMYFVWWLVHCIYYGDRYIVCMVN